MPYGQRPLDLRLRTNTFNRARSNGDNQETTRKPGECRKMVSVLFPPTERVVHHFNGVGVCVFFVTLNLLRNQSERRVTVVYLSVCVHIE